MSQKIMLHVSTVKTHKNLLDWFLGLLVRIGDRKLGFILHQGQYSTWDRSLAKTRSLKFTFKTSWGSGIHIQIHTGTLTFMWTHTQNYTRTIGLTQIHTYVLGLISSSTLQSSSLHSDPHWDPRLTLRVTFLC